MLYVTVVCMDLTHTLTAHILTDIIYFLFFICNNFFLFRLLMLDFNSLNSNPKCS